MKTIEELALELADEMGLVWRDGCNYEGGILEPEVIDFSQLLIAAWQVQQEPVAYRKLLKFEDGTEEYKYMSFKVMKDAEPLYLAPPPAQGEQK